MGPSHDESVLVDIQKALQDLKEWMRIKHYAIKIEQSYLNWCKRFFQYCSECSGGSKSGSVPVSLEPNYKSCFRHKLRAAIDFSLRFSPRNFFGTFFSQAGKRPKFTFEG